MTPGDAQPVRLSCHLRSWFLLLCHPHWGRQEPSSRLVLPSLVPDLITCFQIRLLLLGRFACLPPRRVHLDPSDWEPFRPGTPQAGGPTHPSPLWPDGALAGVSYVPCRPGTHVSQAHGCYREPGPGVRGGPRLLSGAPIPLLRTPVDWVIPVYSRPSFCLFKTGSGVMTA